MNKPSSFPAHKYTLHLVKYHDDRKTAIITPTDEINLTMLYSGSDVINDWVDAKKLFTWDEEVRILLYAIVKHGVPERIFEIEYRPHYGFTITKTDDESFGDVYCGGFLPAVEFCYKCADNYFSKNWLKKWMLKMGITIPVKKTA